MEKNKLMTNEKYKSNDHHSTAQHNDYDDDDDHREIS